MESAADFGAGGVPPTARVGRLFATILATAVAYLLAYPITGVFVLVGSLAALIGLAALLPLELALWGRLVFWLAGRRVRVSGRERIEPDRRYIVVANHSSMYDIPALFAVMPRLAFIGREKMLRIPVFGYFLRAIGYIPIDAENAVKAGRSMDEAVRAARQGASIGIFPEGTRTQTGRVQRLKRGFIRLLRMSGHDLLPVTIRGTFALKP